MTKKSKTFRICFVGIDLERSKTCFKTKISILRIFPIEFFFQGQLFLENLVIKRPKIFEKPLFSAIFGQKFDKSSEPVELDRRRDAYNSAQ